MEFLIDVDALFTFETICEESIGALTRADGDVARASAIVSQQESLLVHRCNEDLLTTSQTYEEMAADLKALKLAVSDLAWSMRSVRGEYQGIAQAAAAGGLIVEGDTVILPDEQDAALSNVFGELSVRAREQRLNYERAEYVFSLALDDLKIGTYEQWIKPVFDGLKEHFVLSKKHRLAIAVPYALGLLDFLGQSTVALTMQHFSGLYEAPEGFLARGDLSKWKFRPPGAHGLEPTGTRVVAPIAGKIGKVAGVAGAVVDGGITAYDTYQTDTVQHPEWSEGHKVARAGVKGVTTGGATFVMGVAGAKVGAAVGAACSGPFAPVGALVGGLVGGVIGGLAGHYGGEYFGDLINEQGTDRIAESIG
ncbi:hypothetical protein [Schaalia odontolytica]|uniref:hypothetical protein n=1 Tax=Schaalia odontolytica TaxID=1660 RepID=UPI00211CA210|nr:hypothetical protein [Schaalia odontolytica]UUO93744.1 hypothetical protein NQK35_01075 [Schaalia odontolytica]